MSTPPVPLLQTRDLSIGYCASGKQPRILASSLELGLYPGQLVCLLGPNGSGKSTLIRTLSGLQKPLSGTVELLGTDITGIKPADLATRLSMVLTEKVQAGNLDVYTVIALGRSPYTNWKGRLDEEDTKIVEHAVRMTRTESFLSKRIHELSDGERQRVMLARALAQDTPVVILDEPTAYLDLPNRISLMRLLHELTQTTGKSILLSTHDLELALQTADQLWLLSADGSLLQGLPEDLVLDGSFEKVFLTEGFGFDKTSGTFLIQHKARRAIRVTGTGIPLIWTCKALWRKGYRCTEEASEQVEIRQESGSTSWIYRCGSEEMVYHSIAGLLDAVTLKSKTEREFE